jgi:hypothetical protein
MGVWINKSIVLRVGGPPKRGASPCQGGPEVDIAVVALNAAPRARMSSFMSTNSSGFSLSGVSGVGFVISVVAVASPKAQPIRVA